jgi:hypothetical protein
VNNDVELLLREGLDRLTADPRVPAGMAGRVLVHRRRRRAAGYAAPVAAAAAVTAVVVVVVAATGGTAGPAATRTRAAASPAASGPALATAYLVRRVENALANDDQVMRETTSVAPGRGGAAFFDGQLSYQSVTWAYQGRDSTEIFGVHGQLQATMGTGIVNGKLRGVQVDYIRHEWELIPGMLSGAPVNACTTAGFGEATVDPGTNWPLLIRRTLACGGYKVAGYADIGRAETVRITGSRVIDLGSVPPGHITVTDTLFVSPSTYLPVRITQSAAAPGEHDSLTSEGVQWLPPTTANRARASVTVPCGYQQISWPSGKPASGQPSSSCR